MKFSHFLRVFSTLIAGIVICAAGAALADIPAGTASSNTNVLLVGGVIAVLNEQDDMAEALAYDAQGKIIGVGRASSVRALAGEGAREVDLKGALVLPGFQDVHLHAVEAGVNADRCLLSEFGSRRRYRSEIADCAEDQKDAPWFIGAGVSMPDLLYEIERPIDLLDRLIPDKPALVLDNLGHGAWANSLAMQTVGYDRLRDNPQGGLIDVDYDDELTGVVYENAQQRLRDAALPDNAANRAMNYASLKSALGILARHGITSISDAGGYWTRGHHEAWAKLDEEQLLTVRASNALYLYPDRDFKEQLAAISRLRTQGEYYRFDQVKIYVDGIISQGTARLKTAYTAPPPIAGVGRLGFEYFPRDELMAYARRLDAQGFSLHFHATGDKGVALALDAIAAARRANGDRGNRHRVTHLFLVDPADIPRFAQLNVTADVQVTPSSITPETIRFYRSLLGSRAKDIIPVDALLKSGANVTLSSDWDADELNPLVKIQQALLRKNGQAVTDVTTALKMMTVNAARLLRHDDITGTLEVGKRADLAILNRNLFTIPISEIAQAEVVATVFDGAPVYDPQGLFE